VDDVFGEAALMVDRLLQAQDLGTSSWRDGAWSVDMPTAINELQLDEDPDMTATTSAPGAAKSTQTHDAKGKGKARADSPMSSVVPPSPAPIHLPYPRTSPTSMPSPALLVYSMSEAYPEHYPTPEFDLTPQLPSIPLCSRSHAREQERCVKKGTESSAADADADDEGNRNGPYDAEDVTILSDIEGSDGGLTTPGASPRIPPLAPSSL